MRAEKFMFMLWGDKWGHPSAWAKFWIIATIHSNFSGGTACIVRCYHRTWWKIFNRIISALAELWQAIGQLHTDWIQSNIKDFFKNPPLEEWAACAMHHSPHCLAGWLHEMSQSGKYFIVVCLLPSNSNTCILGLEVDGYCSSKYGYLYPSVSPIFQNSRYPCNY